MFWRLLNSGKTTMLPLKTLSYDINDTVVEEELMGELELNPELVAEIFSSKPDLILSGGFQDIWSALLFPCA